MRIPKKYGSYKKQECPFCGKQATTQNKQGVPVCIQHKNKDLWDFKCMCGEWLDVRSGKYGPYFNCMKCGNINFNKAMEMNPKPQEKTQTKQIKAPAQYKAKQESKKEITISSDELDFYY